MSDLPNPGSEKARLEGCTCPVIDNHYGKGFRGEPDSFVFTANCPVHAADFRKLKQGGADV